MLIFSQVGLNAGNGRNSFEYQPYSQSGNLINITNEGWTNGFSGRHIFQIDEIVHRGSCNNEINELTISSTSGNMLGGNVVNVTGPCFDPKDTIHCTFGTVEVQGIYVDRNRAICIQPQLKVQGPIIVTVRLNSNNFCWRTRYFVEPPATAQESIWFLNIEPVFTSNQQYFPIFWDYNKLSPYRSSRVKISLYGFLGQDEQVIYIDELEDQITNIGIYTVVPQNYRMRNNSQALGAEFGFIQISLANPEEEGQFASP